ncbi:hypothetical protein ACFO9Q_21195 [Paenibacillus sp. GCM10023252]|uniref:hypothetical protein n=1 Tax=Paenibacillus sp. GCM10023252 TaxID=3252649 RepID=UPI00361B36F1
MGQSIEITSSMIKFFQNNVLSVTDLTRSNKLSEILESFSNRKSEDIYLVQNTRNRSAMGAIIDVELLEELLAIRESIAGAVDEAVERSAADRVESFQAKYPISNVLFDMGIEDIDVDEIKKLSDELEI